MLLGISKNDFAYVKEYCCFGKGSQVSFCAGISFVLSGQAKSIYCSGREWSSTNQEQADNTLHGSWHMELFPNMLMLQEAFKFNG
jgi:hypothetical protein